jgi:hypothetical protein
MQERIHEQISHELKQATRLDTKITIIAIVVTLILFTIAMIFASSATGSVSSLLGSSKATVFNTAPTIIMFVCVLATAAVNWYAVRTLLNNKKQRAKMNKGLMKLYKDEGVNQYYDGSIFKGYETRYDLFAIIVAVVGAVSIIAPLVIFINSVIEL